ncbi:hypothetical protein FOMG_19879 [Fusarium oxysporum f. sp. melonis 26406]|uniref:Uncharacterized protein n=1 Tax=Fusarium oxysporum f. sp. melonis 26406 TaxID=1089452 RepID=W9YVY0_FUSOX|nr:hypothetical protein FOMG_19879 [Fusarium oxysporum f. sp. melonis 26406]
MDIEQLSSQAANVYDDNSFIRVDHNLRDQPTDITCRPVNNPVPDRGYNFRPVHLPDRSFRIESLPPEPLLLFQQFLLVWLVENWVCYTNSWDEVGRVTCYSLVPLEEIVFLTNF